MRKIRVICSDPYATDCSSDDEESIKAQKPSNGKLFVQEISISIPTLHLDSLANARLRSGDSSPREDGLAKDGSIRINQEIDGTVTENHRNLGRKKHPGLRMRASGKWGVELHHPFKGKKIWLGTFNTVEEATVVYKKKKLEFALLSELNKQRNHNMLRAKHKIKHRRERLVVDGLTVYETESGKWAAWTRDPVSNVIIWLGLYVTPEEAVMSYSRKKFDFDSNYNLELLGKASLSVEDNPQDDVVNHTCNIAAIIDTDVASSRCPCIELTETGRWAVIIKHPSMKCRHCLGSYNTSEEAAEVYDKKKIKLEAESESQGDKIGGSTSGVRNQESYFFQKVFARTSVIDSQGLPVKYKGVRFREPGRWASEIKDPFKRRNMHIGTFSTPEEAADAYNKKRCEFEARMSRRKKQKFIDDADSHTDRLASKAVGVIPEGVDVGATIKTEPNNASPSFTLDTDNSTVTAVSSQNSEGSNTNNDNQIPGSSLAAEDGFGFGVINSYGQFMGEYSRIDDELWLTRPGDYDDCDLHGTMGVTGDLASDVKPSSYLPN